MFYGCFYIFIYKKKMKKLFEDYGKEIENLFDVL